ncbi:DegT/DnrJ/EryC1/StrS family aminotransferase [Saccharothrix syringae]|uniref:DegT/DnrJ/EryC1/StrS family aminotransferase n=1 Tax=Saccharothrix syringae TaxID=103733 RepID=A0A5Q0H5V9_SACSY|nr:DegT/DnrJ/EryC1/StrS family aminotransferase [Saccharothrix syringae]QFZ21230.1 DegT/DnrJ/EryC1/StrS family aminotransferase [Saccharothrix syringae]
MIPLFKVSMSDAAPAEVEKVLLSGFVGQGPKVDEFERALAARIGNPRLATVNSATSGLHLALHLVTGGPGGPGGEVLTTPMTCSATNWPILANGLKIKWVDVDPGTMNVDLDDLARKISPATKAIVLVHWSGYPVDLARLRAVLDQAEQAFGFRPVVIEDCAHSWGATFQGEPLGNHGNIAVFSFQAIKHLTCGDGGLMVLPDEELRRRARLLRWYGIERETNARFMFKNDIPEYGFKFHMNDINASIGLANLDLADANLRRHRENAAHFDAHLADVPGLELTERSADREPSFWIYTVKVDDRDGFMRKMDEAGVMVSQVHERNDVYSGVREFATLLPGLDSVSERMVSIPVGWWLTEDDRDHIVSTIRSGW